MTNTLTSDERTDTESDDTPRYVAVIPSIGRSRYLPALLDVLARDEHCDHIRVYDNEPDPPDHSMIRNGWHNCTAATTTRSVLGELQAHKINGSIYDAWRMGMDAAESHGCDAAILNDDIVLPEGSILQAQRALDDACPLVGLNYGPGPGVGLHGFKTVTGTFKDGGIGGFAFVVDPTFCPRPHPGFRWWYGDDDLMRRVSALGLQLRIAFGAPVSHPEPSTSGNQMDWRLQAISEDEALYRELWG